MPIEVSVVVPVYNTGAFIEPCIDSLVGQTLAADRYEVVFVDDGSTDESPQRLDELAAQHPNVRVLHEANSGWSGRPRNVGLDAARGDYVFFCDHDDWLELDALARMISFAHDNDSDIVVAKMVGHRRGVPVDLFDKTVGDATPWTEPLMTSLTPHKLFRRSFLNAHGLRFPEAKRRLEDHIFVVGAYVAADRISVLGDGLYYHHIRRPDAGNAGFGSFDAVGYYTAVRETLDVIESHVEAGPQRDVLKRRAFSTEMIERLRGQRLRVRPEGERRPLFSEVHRLMVERFSTEFEMRTGAVTRVFATAVRADQFDVAMDLNERSAGLAARASLTAFSWRGDGWRVEITAEMLLDGAPVLLTPSPDDGWLIDPRLIPTDLQVPLESDAALRQVSLRVTLVNRTTDEEWGVDTSCEVDLQEIPDQPGTFRLVVNGYADIRPDADAGGKVLPNGLWDVRVRLGCFGTTRQTRLWRGSVPRRDSLRPAIVGSRPATVIPYFTKGKDNFALDVGQSAHTLRAGLFANHEQRPAPAGPEVSLAIDVEPGAAPRSLRLALLAANKVRGQCAARIVGGTPQAKLVFDRPRLSGKGNRTVPRGEYTISTRIRRRDDPTVLGRVRINLRGEIVAADLSRDSRRGVAPLPRAYQAQRRARAIVRRAAAWRNRTD